MEQPQQETGRHLRLALVALGLLGLLTLVAFASRGGLGRTTDSPPTPAYVSYAMTLFLILFVLAVPVAIYAQVMQIREQAVERKSFQSRVVRSLLTVGVFVVVGAVAIYLRTHHTHLFNFNSSMFRRSGSALSHGRGKKGAARYEPQFEWTVFWVAVAVLAVIAAALVISWRRRRGNLAGIGLHEPSMADEIADSMSDAIDDLEAEPDARRAVIAAYARMETVLGRHGLERRPSQTPVEYLRRVLLDLTTRAEAVSRLTDLFEQAKFSSHPIGRAMKQDAIGALREIRDDLRGVDAPA
jgi:hypothetical protein